MSEVPFWAPAVLSVILTAIVGAYLLSIVEVMYRLENWLATWPLLEPVRAERRDAFEQQLAAFLDRERRQGYQPQSSGLRLCVRMLSTLPADIWDAVQATARRVVLAALWITFQEGFVTRWPSALFTVARFSLRPGRTAVMSRDAALPLIGVLLILLALYYLRIGTPPLGTSPQGPTASDSAHFTESVSIVKTTVVH